MMYRVMKRLYAAGKQHKPGDVVDGTDWKWAPLLVEQRKLFPIPEEMPTPENLARPAIAGLEKRMAVPTARRQAAVRGAKSIKDTKVAEPTTSTKRGRGRPKGAKNKPVQASA